nr:hypothetical protein [Tanacetum cinerariifolium]
MSSRTRSLIAAGTVGLVEALKDQGFARWNYTIRTIHHHAKSNIRSVTQSKKLSSQAAMASSRGIDQSEESMRKVIASTNPTVPAAINDLVLELIKNQMPEAGQTSMARDESVFRYDPDYLREQFASLVIQRALPFNHFNHEQTTRVFQNTMQPIYTHVSRSTLKRDEMKLLLVAKQEIIDSFGNINACVNLTTDIWPAPHGVSGSYMCVTAH